MNDLSDYCDEVFNIFTLRGTNTLMTRAHHISEVNDRLLQAESGADLQAEDGRFLERE